VVIRRGTSWFGQNHHEHHGACGLNEVQAIGDISENTFLSGFHGHKDPGLLEKLGPTTQEDHIFTTTGNAVLLIKDFTTVLAMSRQKRGAILAQLREMTQNPKMRQPES